MSKEKSQNEAFQALSGDRRAKVMAMVSQGTKLQDAIAKVQPKAKPAATSGEKPKMSAADKKAALTKEIEALNGEVPAEGASVAKFEEALTAAKAAAEEGGDKDEENKTDGEDLI